MTSENEHSMNYYLSDEELSEIEKVKKNKNEEPIIYLNENYIDYNDTEINEIEKIEEESKDTEEENDIGVKRLEGYASKTDMQIDKTEEYSNSTVLKGYAAENEIPVSNVHKQEVKTTKR